MGRLQRKKDPAKKKKQQKKNNEEPQKDGGDVISLQSVSADENIKRKRSAPSSKKNSWLTNQNTFVGKSTQFLREAKAELKKVTWPSRRQTTGSTVVVIVLVFIISFFLGLVDMGLSGLVRLILG